MARISRHLSLAALNCNWSVIRTPESSILTCTWFFGDGETIGLVGQFSHLNIGKSGVDVWTNTFLQRYMTGMPVKMFSASSVVSLGTWQSMSASALANLNHDCYLYGIQATGFLSEEELGNFMKVCHSAEIGLRPLWTRQSEAGVLVMDMLTLSSSSPLHTEKGELDMWVG